MGILQDIQAGVNYRGDATLGGALETPLQIDYSPISQLAQYTYLYNREKYQQRQKDADEKIKQLASLTAYDLVNGHGKDKEAVIKAQAELQNYMADFAAKGTPKTADEKIRQQLEFQTKIKDVTKLINAANTRAIGYMAQQEAINKDDTLTAAQKANLIKDLDDTFKDTDIYTPIPALPKFKAPSTDVGEPAMKETAVVQISPNGFTEEKTKIFDPKASMSRAFLLSHNLELAALPPNATELQKKEYKQRLLEGDTNTIWQQAAQNYASALNDPNYKKTVEITTPNVTGQEPVTQLTTEVDYDKIKANNPIIGGIFDLVDRYNAYAEQKKEQATTVYTDNVTGKTSTLLPAINPADYFTIDKSKPLTTEQLVFLQQFAKASPDKVEKNYTNTGAANAIKLKQIDEAGANYRARLSLEKKIGGGTATPDDKNEYTRQKTQELVNSIGLDGKPKNFTDLTPEQQSKIKQQTGTKVTDFSTISIEGGKIKVSGTFKDSKDKNSVSKEVSLTIMPDDIKKSYDDEINKNDAGKESYKRTYFKLEDGKTDVKIKITDYDPSIQAGIKAFMKANKLSEEDAIKLLKENKKID